jgi:hypothetical protein
MHDLWKTVLTACVTLGGGVFLLIATQVLTRFVVDPLVDFRRLLGEVAYTLILNAHYFHNAAGMGGGPEFEEAKRQCRALASRLHAFSAAVPLYGTLACIGLVPAQTSVYDAAAQLVGLSNSTVADSLDFIRERYDRISKLLGIRLFEPMRLA